MAGNEKSGVDRYSDATEVVKDLIYERAKWVRKWVIASAFPFVALTMLMVSCYEINQTIGRVPQATVLLSAALIFIVCIRMIRPLLRKNWTSAFGNYHISMLCTAALLPLGFVTDEPRTFLWAVLPIAYWMVGLVSAKGWLMPGEFSALSLLAATIMGRWSIAIPIWIYALIVYVPVMFWLNWRLKKIGTALFLALLILAVWQQAHIAGVVLPLIASLLLIALGVYAIGKLNDGNASGLIRSFALAVISAVILFVAISIFQFKVNSPLAWWLMTALFAATAMFIHRVVNQRAGALLVSWTIHWLAVSICVSLDAVRLDYYLVFAILAFPLRIAADRLKDNHLQLWSQIYLLIATIVLLPKLNSDSVSQLLSILLIYLFSPWAFGAPPHEAGPAWWKHILNPRHVVAIRQMLKKSGKFTASIPVIGVTVSAVASGILVLSKLKRGGQRMVLSDLLLILLQVVIALILTDFTLDKLLLPDTIERLVDGANLKDPHYLVGEGVAFTVGGILFGILALVRREPYLSLLAMVCFLVSPIRLLNNGMGSTAIFWLFCFASAAGIFVAREGKEEQLRKSH